MLSLRRVVTFESQSQAEEAGPFVFLHRRLKSCLRFGVCSIEGCAGSVRADRIADRHVLAVVLLLSRFVPASSAMCSAFATATATNDLRSACNIWTACVIRQTSPVHAFYCAPA